MARRSLGVVLIVALVSWTVNQLTFGCQGQHSRAAVVVPAGASPAYQPEPSPSRHTCCPQVKRPAGRSPDFCLAHVATHADCCSASKQAPTAISPKPFASPRLERFAAPVAFASSLVLLQQNHGAISIVHHSLEVRVPSHTVLRI